MQELKAESGVSRTVPAKSARAFFFNRVIRINERERVYCRRCLSEVREALRDELRTLAETQIEDSCDILNPLTHYLLFLEEVLAGRRIRYYDLLDSVGMSAAFLGHRRILELISEAGCDLESLRWSESCYDEMTILGYAIRGHRFGLVKRLLKLHPALALPHPSRPDVVAWCVRYGTPKMLDFLRASGFRMDRSYYWEDGRGFLGTPMRIAVRYSRKQIVRNLLAHGEIGVGAKGDSPSVYFRPLWWDALETRMDDLVEACRRRGDVNEGELDAARRQQEKDVIPWPSQRERCVTIGGLANDLRHWMQMNDPAMVVFELCKYPEILSLVSVSEISRIRAFFLAAENPIYERVDYLLRYAHAKGIELFANDAERVAFWNRLTADAQEELRPHLARLGWSESCRNDLASAPRMSYDLCSNRFDEECLDEHERKTYAAAAVATGSGATMYLDDPGFNPHRSISWWEPFSNLLIESVDWRTVRRWILRGVRIYHDNFDDPGMLPIYGSKATLRHLTDELQMRPWLSQVYCGDSLGRAASTGDLEGVRRLLDLGCPVNFAEEHCTALRVALMHGHDRIARYLFVRGGLNLDEKGRAFPVPEWIVRRSKVFRPRTMRWKGRRIKIIPIDLLTALPRPLARLRGKCLDAARTLNGNTCSLLHLGNRITVSYHGRSYDIFAESFGLDREAFGCLFEDIERDLVHCGCELISRG